MDWTTWNDNNNNNGIEGKYLKLSDSVLVVYVKPTNTKKDWKKNFTATPIESTLLGCMVHAGYLEYSIWLRNYVSTLLEKNEMDSKSTVYIFGYSMGGGVAREAFVNQEGNIYIGSIAGPRTTSILPDNLTLFYKKGGLVHNVPPWFPQARNKVCMNKHWQPVWKSHRWEWKELLSIMESVVPGLEDALSEN